ncbi:multicopper oxidase family protein [Methylobacterium organophilum]|uniref:Multicopper oxidase MmcO n=1 Tax=Methylobacterium organophilum TaxID=410 RepID=A0ABQ4T3P6_METOR|nr:multicopper oxidase family protein [Methylobacterium organophilum]GJE26223.1 Multicopper oxidase MmcO [Methylobacterium organophilum]
MSDRPPPQPTSEPGFSRRALLAGAAALLPAGALAQAGKPAASPAPPSPSPAEAPPAFPAAPGRVRFRPEPAAETEIWCFDGKTAPPLLRGRQGEPFRLKVANRTAKPLSLHWHGIRNRNAMDGVGGVTQPPIAPGAEFTYEFVPPDSGTSLIRPLVVGGASEPSGRGLAGLFVVAEKAPPALDHDLGLLMQDWRLEEDGRLAPFGPMPFAAASGRLGNLVTLNGKPIPETIELRPGARVRLRLANGCNARSTRIRFDGLKVYVVAVDGQPTDTFEPLRATLPFPPGTRYDLMFDMPAEMAGGGSITALIGNGFVLAKLVAKGEPVTEKRPPIAALPENTALPAEIKLQNAFRRDIVLTGGARIDKANPAAEPAFSGDPARIWQVNGASGGPDSGPAFSVKRGQAVVLAIRNDTAFTQALHLHGHVFRLLHPLDDGWEPYWLDTFQLVEGKTARIAFIADNPGRWLLGATVLERFDTGLWTSFEVT